MAEVYVPAAWFIPTFSVAPTRSDAVPAANVPVVDGVLVNAVTVIVLAPEVIVKGEAGNEIENVYVGAPVTLKAAAVTVPVTAGSVTPPVRVLPPAGASITVPATALTATLPKFISTVFVILIGIIMVAEEEELAET